MRIALSAGTTRRTPQLASAALFALLCGIVTWWALELLAPRTAVAPTSSLVDARRAADLRVALPLFGAPASGPAASVAASTDIVVLGVAASADRGSAVLAIDGAAPKAFQVGDAIDARSQLVEIGPDEVVIGRGDERLRLATPPRPDPALLSSGPATTESMLPAAPVAASPAAAGPRNAPGSGSSPTRIR